MLPASSSHPTKLNVPTEFTIVQNFIWWIMLFTGLHLSLRTSRARRPRVVRWRMHLRLLAPSVVPRQETPRQWILGGGGNGIAPEISSASDAVGEEIREGINRVIGRPKGGGSTRNRQGDHRPDWRQNWGPSGRNPGPNGQIDRRYGCRPHGRGGSNQWGWRRCEPISVRSSEAERIIGWKL
jgi:hypothetical protein